ncbi:proline-rich protein 18 isoform X2 [Leopardus geoffroyi]|nr:proline-rich protein 18 isoform X2 [Leopardus geoffroyi]
MTVTMCHSLEPPLQQAPMTRRLGGTMPFPPTPTPGAPAARPPPRRPGAPRRAAPARAPPAPAPSPPAAAADRRRPPEGALSGSWPPAALKRSPARRGPGPPRAPARPARSGHSPAGDAAPGTGPAAAAAAARFSPGLPPEAVLLLQGRHLQRRLPARPCRPPPSPSPAGPGRRPAPRVSLLNERHRYDDVEYEEEARAVDEGLVRRCTEWLRGVESAAAARDLAGPLDTLPHLSTL